MNARACYVHQDRKRTVVPAVRGVIGLSTDRQAMSLDPLTERIALAMVNESTRRVEEVSAGAQPLHAGGGGRVAR